MNPPSTTLITSSRCSFVSGGEAIEYGRGIDLPAFSPQTGTKRAGWEVEDPRLALDREADHVRGGVLGRDVEDLLDDRGVLGGAELQRRLLERGLGGGCLLRWHRLPHHRGASDGRVRLKRLPLVLSRRGRRETMAPARRNGGG